MGIMELSRLQRYVKYYDLILKSDHNDLRQLAIALASRCELVNTNYQLTELTSLVDDIKNRANAIREVKEGEYVLADDHNCFVELAQKFYEWCEKASQKIGLTPQALTDLKTTLATLETVKFGDLVLPDHHNRLVKFYAELLPSFLAGLGFIETSTLITLAIVTPLSLTTELPIRIDRIRSEVTGMHEAWNYPPYTSETFLFPENWDYPPYTDETLKLAENWNYPPYTSESEVVFEGWNNPDYISETEVIFEGWNEEVRGRRPR